MSGLRVGSLRSRLFLATSLIVVVSVGITVAIGTVLTRRSVEDATAKDLSRLADVLAQQQRKSLNPFSDTATKSIDRLVHSQRVRFEPVELRLGSPYLDSRERMLVLRGRPLDGTKTIAGAHSFFAARLVVCPEKLRRCPGSQRSKRPKALVLLKSTKLTAADWRPFLEGLLLAALVGAVLAGLAASFLARAIARPVHRVAQASRRLALDETPERLPIAGADELATLSASFNHMASELTKARAAERQFLLSVSHELKTPLTAIRGYAEALVEGAFDPDEAGETIAREAGRLERLVRDLLDLARMNKSEFGVHTEPLDLGDMVDEVVRRYEGQARSFGIRLDGSAAPDALALGDPDRVLQIVSNLVENALRLTPPHGSVRIRASRGALAVEDTGPGLRPDELARAFDRFFLYSRYGTERSVGTGLGLAIVKELTNAMGGTVDVRSMPGEGARFTVRLPTPALDGVEDGKRAVRLSTRDLTPAGDG